MISVRIADDQDLVRVGLRMVLEAEPDIAVGGEAGDGGQVLAAARALDPDVILMDIHMPGMNGIEATTRLIQGGSRARILMLTTFNGPAPGPPADGGAGRLSERELDVVRLVAQGMSNAEIAARLYLSETTIKSHITRMVKAFR